MDINLLPQELRPKRSVLKLSVTLKKIGLISVVFLVIGAVLITALIVFFTQRTQVSLDEQSKLTNQIKSLQATEQKLVLVRDRVQKINSIISKDSTKAQIMAFKTFLGLLPASAVLDTISVDPGGLEVRVGITTLDEVTGLFKAVTGSGFSLVKLTGFSYSKDGYGLVFNISK
jgi:Tfp pilus assembly protein PilN